MPQGSIQEWKRYAKGKGKPFDVKASDLGGAKVLRREGERSRRRHALGAHSAKKSGRIVARASTADRTVSTRRRPGEGRSRPRGAR